MTCEVVLSSYNGEKYIYQQLESILKQTRQPDSVLIFDDCSEDNTREIVKSFIECNHLNHWKLVSNVQNLGWKKNFWQGIGKANSDIIFLCDQDDIWRETKVEKMMEQLEKNPHIDLLACAYEPIYDDMITRRISPKILKNMQNSGEIKQIRLDSKWMYVIRPGCTYAFSRRLYDVANSAWSEEFAHDAVLWRAALLRKSAYLYEENLMYWRRYSASSSNPLNVYSEVENRFDRIYYDKINTIQSHISFLQKIKVFLEQYGDEESIQLVEDNLEFRIYCQRAFTRRNVIDMLRTVLRYGKFYYSYKTALYDIGLVLISIFKKTKECIN